MNNYHLARQEWKKLGIKYYFPQVDLDIEFDLNIALGKPKRDKAKELEEFYVWSESMGYLKRQHNRDKGSGTLSW
jgi:hypothetical protein